MRGVELTCVLAVLAGACAWAALPATMKVRCFDPVVTGYATFQSHNQKIVANRNGIFTAYIRTRNEPFTAQTWRLIRSTDGGKTFTVLHEETSATHPPTIETDAAGNIYLIRADYTNRNAYLYRFLASKQFRDPAITTIPGASGFKHTMMLDEKRRQLYYFPNNTRFYVLGLDGALLTSQQLISQGPHAMLMYPLLSLEANGTLHAAWTTQKYDIYMYWDIHHMLSRDGGRTWQNLDGTPLTLPVIVDDTGPALRLTRDDEYEVHTFLANVLARAGKLHFTYLAQSKPGRQHYLRYDIATGKRDVDVWPEFKGETISLKGLDGFFASRARDPKAPIYCVMAEGGHVACLESTDQGATWHDYARSEATFRTYAIGGCREISKDGYILGTFTDATVSPADLTPQCKAYLIKIKAFQRPRAATPAYAPVRHGR